MHTFCQIAQYIFNKDIGSDAKYFYLDGSIKKSSEFLQYHFQYNCDLNANGTPKIAKTLFLNYISSKTNETQTKLAFLNEVFENTFITQAQRDEFIECFCKVQRTYNALSRLAYRFKFKRAPIQISNDIYMNPIRENDPRTITLLQNGKKYVFAITDLINIINRSLGNTCYFFAEPLTCKNPYTNVPFTKAMLYNIYFSIKRTSFIMPMLFHHFFLCNFHIKKFGEMHEEVIREHSIKNRVYKANIEEVYEDVMDMIYATKYRALIVIDEDFPKERLVNIMRPYLELYFLSSYSSDVNKRDVLRTEFFKKMRQFHQYNKQFGRKVMVKEPQAIENLFTNKHTYRVSFNDKHVNFYENDYDTYEISHIHVVEIHDEDSNEE
jgi:hypothetical protein